MVDGIADQTVDSHYPMDELALDYRRRDEDFPGAHPCGPLVFGEQAVEQGGPGAEVADDKDRLLDILIFQMGKEEVIKAVSQADAKLPEGVEKEDEQEDEKTLGRQPSRGPLGFEETDVKCLEEKLDVRDHMVESINSAQVIG